MVSFQSAKEEIKRAADIVELIGQFVQLKKAGLNFVGLCPFHAEKAPSFTVSPARQTFHCFGCKKGGDIFTFWMEYHSSTFPEAVRDLAERYQVHISKAPTSSSERKKAAQRESIFRVNEIAATYFHRLLSHPVKGKPARVYLSHRAVPEETISEFRIGYVPDEWDGLVRALRHENTDLEAAVRAGLIISKKSGGYYDRFRGRIIFPIIDLRQKVIGFGGRVLDDSLPKYLNTPETPVFHKGEVLFGMNVSHRMIREKGRAVVVEGYMDCIALKGHGLDEVVATLGTALTDRHVRKLKGYANEAVVLFDSDEAGKAAASKSLPTFSNEGLTARAVVLPDGHDPDSFVNERGLQELLEVINQASPLFDFHLEQKLKGADSDVGRVRVLEEILPVLSEVRNFALRSLYVRRLAERIGVKEEVVLSELEVFMKKTPRKGKMGEFIAPKASRKLSELQLLGLLVNSPQVIPRLMDSGCEAVVSDPLVRELLEIIFRKYRQEGSVFPEALLENLDSEGAREQLVEVLHSPIPYSEEEVELAVAELEKSIYQKKISESFEQARKLGDTERLVQLTKLKAQGPARP